MLALPFAPHAARAGLAPNEIMVGLPNNVYASLYDGLPNGIMVEAINTVLVDMGWHPRYIVMSGAEVAAAIKEGMIGVNAVTVQTPSNAGVGLYTAPIVNEYNIVAVRQGQNLTVDRLADLHGLHLGGRAGYLYPLLDADPAIQLERFPQDGELIRNLIHGKIDAAIISALSDVYRLRAEGVMTRIKLLKHAVGIVPLRAVLSVRRFTPDNLKDFDERLEILKAGPDWEAILQRNGFADLAIEWPIIQG
jgi:ABC-type amino acid transport substrate-binding protein